MKQIITLLIALSMISVLTASAQGTLQFNQVLMVGNAAQTVPANKVWKVESYLFNNSTAANSSLGFCTGSSSNPQAYVLIAPPSGSLSNFFVRPVTANPTSSGQWGFGVTLPFWLPAGAQLASNCSTWYLSVIEFNIVQ